MRVCYLWLLVLSLAVPTGCANTPNPSGITVSAASSLQPLLDSIRSGFEKQTGVELHITYSASGAMARQIEQGAPIDVFISAGDQYIDDLVKKLFLRQDSVTIIGHGQLVIVRPLLGDDVIPSFAEAQRIAIANPEIAPYGAAAKHLLESAGLWNDIESHIVYAQSALQAFQFARAGEVDYAFVPLPLVHTFDTAVALVDPSALGLPTTGVMYTASITASTTDIEHAQAFVAYLSGPEAVTKLHELGYNSVLEPR
jgi:molybdate transport system substrate-binding protein